MQNLKSIPKQKGAAIILMAFIIGLGAIAYLLHALDPQRLKLEQDKKTMQTLNEAKQALIAWSVSHPNTPGQMPFPDRYTGGGFDGNSDCYTGVFNYAFLIGQLPITGQTNPCVLPQTGLGGDWRDAQGNRLWYEVSRNLVRQYQAPTSDPIINPSIINNPAYPWFTVRDRNGSVISDRVAVVIIAPSEPAGVQDRLGAAAANPNNYLDKIVMADNTPYQNYGYPTSDINVQEFIIGDDYRKVAKNDPTYKNQLIEPYYYNDKLVYITIDELMAALSKRAGEEAKEKLKNYKSAVGYYPYASVLGLTEYYQKDNQLSGLLPIQTPTQPSRICSVTYTSANASSSTCNFSSITNVEFTRSSGTFTGTTGTECTRTNANRTCWCAITSGSSRCDGSAGRRFTCNTIGCATTGTLPGTYLFNGVFKFSTSPTSVKANTYSGICTGCATNVATCSSTGAASGSFSYVFTTTPAAFNSATSNSVLAAWFTLNNWQDYIFYNVSDNCRFGKTCNAVAPPDITVGGKLSSEAMIAATGSTIGGQTRPSCNVTNHLDSTENTDGDLEYDATSKLHNANYNDQTFVVAP